MKLEPFRDYSDHDVIGLFSLNATSGDAGSVLKITRGYQVGEVQGIASNLSNSVNNSYSPRWEVKAKVGLTAVTDTVNKPFGIALYNVRENNEYSYPYLYDKVRKDEVRVVVSGENLPILRRGLVVVSDLPAGITGLINFGTGAAPSAGGNWTITGLTAPSCFGQFLGPVVDGKVMFSLNCYI